MSLWDKIKNEFVNPNSDLRSKIPADITKATAEYTGQFVSKKMPPGSKEWLRENAGAYLTKVTIRRWPISGNVYHFLNAVAGGRLDTRVKELGYDSLFHLSLLIEFDNGTTTPGRAQLEKVERVRFSPVIKDAPNIESFDVPIEPHIHHIGEIIDSMIHNMGDKFYTYDAFDNNCQSFIGGFLKALGKLDYPGVKEFIYQNAANILKTQPGYLGNFAKSITNLGAIVNQTMQGGKKVRGKGKKGKGIISDVYQSAKNYANEKLSKAKQFALDATNPEKVKHEILKQLDKDSFTRQKLIPLAVDVATVAQPFLDVYAPGSGTAVKAIAKGINCASSVSAALGYGKDVKIPKSEFIKEHKNLISILKSNNPKKTTKEAAKQQAELTKMRGGVKIRTQLQFEKEADKRWASILAAQPIERNKLFKHWFGQKDFPNKKGDGGRDNYIVFNKKLETWTTMSYEQLENMQAALRKRDEENPYIIRMIDYIDIDNFFYPKPIMERTPGKSFSRRAAHVRQTYGEYTRELDQAAAAREAAAAAAAAAAPVAPPAEGKGNTCSSGECKETLTPEEQAFEDKLYDKILKHIKREETYQGVANWPEIMRRYNATNAKRHNKHEIAMAKLEHFNYRRRYRMRIEYEPHQWPAGVETTNPARRTTTTEGPTEYASSGSTSAASTMGQLDLSQLAGAFFGMGMRGGNKRSWVKHLIAEIDLYTATPGKYDVSSGVLYGIYNAVMTKYPGLSDIEEYKKGIPDEAEEMLHYITEWIKRRKSSGPAARDPTYAEKIETIRTDLERFYEMPNLSAYGIIKPEKAAKPVAAVEHNEDAWDKALEDYEKAHRRAEHMRKFGYDPEEASAPAPVSAAEKARQLKARFNALKKKKKGNE